MLFRSQAVKVFGHALQTLCIMVKRGQFAVGQLEQMTSFATRGRTRIQHPHAGRNIQQWRSQLCGGILH